MPPKNKQAQEVQKPGVGPKGPSQTSEKVETPKTAAKALSEEQKDPTARADAPMPEDSCVKNSTARADALEPEKSCVEISKTGADAPQSENSCVKNPEAGADAPMPEERKNSGAGAEALAPGKGEVENPKAGADALMPEKTKEVEVKGNENQLQLQQMMSEMIALRQQMDLMKMEKDRENAEKAELMTIINKMQEAAQAKTEADAKVRASESPERQGNSVINFDQSDEEESEQKELDDPERDEDENVDQCTPVPSDEEDEVIDDDEETGTERAKRLDQLKKMKAVGKDAKIAKKVVIKARLDKIEGDMQTSKKVADSIDSKVTDSETELSELRETIGGLEVSQRELNSRLKEKYDTMKRIHAKELSVLQEDHEKKRVVFELNLLREVEDMKEKQKVQTSTLDEDYNKKRAGQNEIQKAVENLKCKEKECVSLKAERERKYEETKKLREKHAEVKKQYESLSLRCQRERKQEQEQEAKAGSWTTAVGRKPVVKIEKTAAPEVRRIPKITLPHIAPKERYQPGDRMPCPSWITRVASNSQACPLGKGCPQLLRGCNQYHKDTDMVMAFTQGIRPVGWTDKLEKNIRYEIEYWNGRSHFFNGLIPQPEQLNAWRRKPDTEDDKKNELRRIARLMECLQAKKAAAEDPNADGPGGPAEGNGDGREERGPRVVQGYNKKRNFNESFNGPNVVRGRGPNIGRGRGQNVVQGQGPHIAGGRGRGRRVGKTQVHVNTAKPGVQPAQSQALSGIPNEEEVDYESGEDNAGESVS